MRFVHSLSTRPFGIQLYNTNTLERIACNIYYYSLSLAYLKRLNQEVVLYTDTLGAALLGHLPYDEIHITLDDMPDGLSPRFWAAGKIYALAQEPLGSIHIDGDVFIKSSKIIDMIENSEYDLITQNYEGPAWVGGYSIEFPYFKGEEEFCKQYGLTFDVKEGFNTGLVGFRNQELKDKFIKGYKEISLYHSKLKYDKLLNDTHRTPDLVVEQAYISQISKGYKVKQLLKPKGEETIREICNSIGYQHVATVGKLCCLDKCIQMLKQISPNIYNKTYKLCRNILNKQK